MASIVILAAGLGSRFGGDKQLVEFGSKQLTLMEYNLLHAVQAGFTRVVFVIRSELKEVLNKQVLPRLPQGLRYEVVLQTLEYLPLGCAVPEGRTKPLGTAHALWCCHHLLTEHFAVINADDYYGEQAFKLLLAASNKALNNHAMVAYPLQNTLSEFGSVNRGLCQCDKMNNLVSIEECEDIIQLTGKIIGTLSSTSTAVELEKNSLISMNCWLFNIDIFPALEQEIKHLLQAKASLKTECYLPNVVMIQIQQQHKKVHVLTTTDQWFGLTYEQDCLLVGKKIDNIFSNKLTK